MLKIGIVGAENSHTVAIAKTLNVQKSVPGARVVAVWGETAELAKKAAEEGQIPQIIKQPEALIGMVDGAVVDHRHGKYHLPAARPLLEAGIPLFIDKPFCYRLGEGKRFLARARQLGVPVCSFSVLPKQAAFFELRKKVKTLGKIQALVSTGSCDIHSRWGGIFFYGIHQVDMVLHLLGYDVTSVQVNQGRGKNHTATLFYRDGVIATMNLIGTVYPAFHISLIGEKGRLDETIHFDENSHLTGIRSFVRMFETGQTDETEQTMLGPVAVLEALARSVKRKARVRVARW